MHLMIDLETLSTDPRAVVLSVGAVLFDRDHIYREFYRELDVDTQLRAGRHVMSSTLGWWVDQGDSAKRVFSGLDKTQPTTVLEELNLFVNSDAPQVQVWANGAGFDLPILTTLYNDAQLPIPWRFYNERCFRTLKNLYEARVPKPKAVEGLRVEHNALSDARHQTLHCMEILKCAGL